jgi:hypothetical protein
VEIEGEYFARMGWGLEKTAAQKTEGVTADGLGGKRPDRGVSNIAASETDIIN